MVQQGERAPTTAVSGRGFTLVELMITIAIIAVLALLAGVGYARWIRTSKTGEATAMISAIKGAEESYRAETNRYLDVSKTCPSGVCGPYIEQYFPTTAPNDQRAPWVTTGCVSDDPCGNFRILNISSDNTSAGVYYRYGVAAGAPIATGALRIEDRDYTSVNDPFFVIKAIGDLNADGKRSKYYTSSMDSTVWSVDPDE